MQTIIVLTKEHGMQSFQFDGPRADAEKFAKVIIEQLDSLGLAAAVIDLGRR